MFRMLSARSADGAMKRPYIRTGLTLALSLTIFGAPSAWSKDVANDEKRIIGATAKLTEVKSGLTFQARIDTGAQSCSLHVEKIDIESEVKSRLKNVGKMA